MFRSFLAWGRDAYLDWRETTVDLGTLAEVVINEVELHGPIDGDELIRHVDELLAAFELGPGFRIRIPMSIILCATFEMIGVEKEEPDLEILLTRPRSLAGLRAYLRLHRRLPRMRFVAPPADGAEIRGTVPPVSMPT